MYTVHKVGNFKIGPMGLKLLVSIAFMIPKLAILNLY